VAGHVDGDDLLEAEVPFQTRVDEGNDEAAGRSVDVDGDVDVPGNEEVVDGFGVFVPNSVSVSEINPGTLRTLQCRWFRG